MDPSNNGYQTSLPFSANETPMTGSILDSAKCNQLSLDEKRELVHKIAERPEDAPKILSSLTRRELLEIICAEMGRERKYTGFTKGRMIEHLLKLLSNKSNSETRFKRQKKQEQIFQPPRASCGTVEEESRIILCENLACRATLSKESVFCKRCSCCICHQFDDNKDPSLWLTCDSESPDEGESCGMSCHLKCAVVHQQAGILKNGCRAKLDGGFYCVSCGKVNGIMRTWRRQLLVAKEARRVDVLCLRVSLSYKILEGTELYKQLLNIVESAVKTLEDEVGPLDWASAKMDRGIVNRLSCSTEVQKLCTSALEAFDSMSVNPCSYYTDHKESPVCQICFENSSPTSVIIVLEYEEHLFDGFLGCRLWHRKSTSKDYPADSTYIVLGPEKRFKLTDLDPSTEYFCKVFFFSNMRTLGVWEAKWVTPALSWPCVAISGEELVEKEPMLELNYNSKKVTFEDNLAKLRSPSGIKENKYEGSLASPPPPTPRQCDGITKLPCVGERKKSKEDEYEYRVKVVRRLEHEGHLNKDFRVKFLTWFSLKATMQERRVVSVFVATLIDDPPSLASQLIDTFGDDICSDKKSFSQHGFCPRLWH